MIQQPFSNEVALRIGLAARRLSSVGVAELIEALQQYLGDDLDEQVLGKITVTQLKSAFRQSADVDGDEDREDFATADMAAFKDAVRILWGETSEEEKLPHLDPYTPGDLPGSVRVAVASNSGEELNGHFGSALRYLIYQVSATELRLVDARSTLEADLTNDKNAARVKLIHDAAVLYTVSIGGPAAAKVIKADIHIMPVPDGGPARVVLGKLQEVLAKKPPPWLIKRQAGLRSSTSFES